MDYKMVVVDLDDSLLGNDLKISEVNKKALIAAVEKGVLVTIATGRMFNATQAYIDELNLNVPVITYQGALIKNSQTGETLLIRTVPINYAQEIISKCREEGLHLQAFVDDTYYYQEENQHSELYHSLTGIKGVAVGDMGDYLNDEPIKMLIIDKPENIPSIQKRFDKLFGGKLQITVSKPFYLEFTHIEATKGKAVEHVGTMFDIIKDEIIAIGDSYNDISMIKYAGLGVAMGNAPEQVKSYADYITKSNIEDGVAKVISLFVLGGGNNL